MPPQAHARVTVVRPAAGWAPLHLRELVESYELLYFLVLRSLKVRYKQTLLGAAWAVLQPLLTMAIFSLVFGRLAKLDSEGVPYPVFALAGLVPWTYFANALTQASNSLVEQERMLTKIYFPRLLLPLASVIAGLIDFAIAFFVLLCMMVFYHIPFTGRILAVPGLMVAAATTALAAGLWLAVLNVRYRDVRHALPFLTQVWLFATPIAYSSTLVPAHLRPLVGLNPMAGIVDGFRWALLGREIGPGATLLVSLGVVSLLLVGGLYYFRRMERTFADVV
ncbi:MAG TPA: ABC transporter permease [Methylomirabilota bacterium]